jgi:hypothetical protein
LDIHEQLTLKTLETFAGRQLATDVISNINHPCNAFNAQSDAHESYDKLAWGIEAVEDGVEVNNIPSNRSWFARIDA